jgi:hypothetical protein
MTDTPATPDGFHLTRPGLVMSGYLVQSRDGITRIVDRVEQVWRVFYEPEPGLVDHDDYRLLDEVPARPIGRTA